MAIDDNKSYGLKGSQVKDLATRINNINSSIDVDVVTDVDVDSNPSTTTVSLEGSKQNLYSGAQTTKTIPLPVASHDEAGVMNSATYDAVSNNTSNINALMNGAVAITGIAASPSQQDLTDAWEAETGLTELMNRASIYDVDNSKVWTYYSNTATWYPATNSSQVTINTFTNSSEGTILGSTADGQVFAENDGTGSVNGWDTLVSNVSDNTQNIGSLQNDMSGKQDALTAGSNISINAQNVISATDTTYSAGDGIAINANNKISANFNDVGARLGVHLDAVNGDDTDTGTSSSHPWKTLGKALSVLNSYGSNLYITIRRAGTYVWPSEMAFFTGKSLTIAVVSGVSGVTIQMPAGVRIRMCNSFLAMNLGNTSDPNISMVSSTPGTVATLEVQSSEMTLEHVDITDIELNPRGSTVRFQSGKLWNIDSQGSNIRLANATIQGAYSKAQAPVQLGEGSDCELGAITLEARTAPLDRPVFAAYTGSHISVNGTLTDNTTAGLSYSYGIGAWASIVQEHSSYAGAYDNVGGGVSISNGSLLIKDNVTLPYLAGTNVSISGRTISATDTTYTHFTGATSLADGTQGLVPGPLAGDEDKYLKADGTWTDPNIPVITMTSTDPGEGQPLAANHFIAVYNP